jgi:lysophospholipase L1-like esterase
MIRTFLKRLAKITKKQFYVTLGIILVLALATTLIITLSRPTEIESHWDVLNEQYILENETALKGQIVFLGDSITEGYLVNDFLTSDLVLYNRGIGGDTTGGVLERLETNVLAIEPKIIVMLIGINDIHGGIDVSKIAENIDRILATIKAALPDCLVYIESIYPTNGSVYPTLTGYWAEILQCNINLQSLCIEYGYTYINVYPLLLDGSQLDIDYSGDGLHLNAAGYDIVSATLVSVIDDLTLKD